MSVEAVSLVAIQGDATEEVSTKVLMEARTPYVSS